MLTTILIIGFVFLSVSSGLLLGRYIDGRERKKRHERIVNRTRKTIRSDRLSR